MASLHPKRIEPLSERLYQLLLLSYPAEFRQTYSQEMLQTFRDCRREALRQYGRWGVVRLWRLMAYDLVTTVLVEHVREFIAQLKRFFAVEERKNITLVAQYSLNVAQRTDIGLQRQNNEDNMAFVIPEDPQVMAKRGALFIVADGLGGHTKGEVASEIAVRAVSDTYYQDEQEEVALSLQKAIKQANTQIFSTNASTSKEMGTTCVVAVLQGDTAYIANVGDSRAYILRNGQIKQVSQDHSVVAEQLRAGLITKDQVFGHTDRNKITRCLGIKSDVEIDVFSEQVQEGDLLLLCTDGLSNVIDDEELARIVQEFQPQESVSKLIDRANEEGGSDNITAMIVQVSPLNVTA